MDNSERNLKGKEFESSGDLTSAIEMYEKEITLNSHAPFAYKRLAIIYRKLNRIEDEVRVLKSLLSVSEKDAKRYGWKEGSKQYAKIESYRKQLEKALSKKAKA